MKQNNYPIKSKLHELAEEAIPSVEIDLWPGIQAHLRARTRRSSNGDKNMKTLITTARFRVSTALLLTAAIFLVLIAATSDGKAWAQNLIQETYQFFVRADSDTVPIAAKEIARATEISVQQTAIPNAMSSQIPINTATPDPGSISDATMIIQDIELTVGFDVLEPTWLPEILTFKGASIEPDHQIVRIFYEYVETNGLVLREEPFGTIDDCELCWKVGASAQIETVQIGDQAGEYVEGVWKASSDQTWEWTPDPYLKTLRWQQNGIAFELMYMGPPDAVNKEDLISIASSLK